MLKRLLVSDRLRTRGELIPYDPHKLLAHIIDTFATAITNINAAPQKSVRAASLGVNTTIIAWDKIAAAVFVSEFDDTYTEDAHFYRTSYLSGATYPGGTFLSQ